MTSEVVVMQDALRVGVVGGGLIAQAVHLPNLQRLAEFEVRAIADPAPTVVDTLANRYQIARRYADWRDLIDAGEIDALIICSPHSTHAEIVLTALAAG